MMFGMSRSRRPPPRLAFLSFLALALTIACEVPGVAGGQARSAPTPPATSPTAVAPSPGASPSPTAAIRPTGTPVYRALWVDAFHDGIKTRSQVNQLIARAHQANLNTLFVQVRKRGDAYFNSGLEQRTNDPAVSRGGYDATTGTYRTAGYDPLAYVIEQAHAANPPLEVHAWVNTFFVGQTSDVWQQHPDWTNRMDNGSNDGYGYLDPGNPAVQAYNRSVFLDIARHYAVDGIHLDFVRYPEGGNWGYTPAAVASFNAALGRSGQPDPTDPDFKQWRRDQVTNFVRDLHDELLHLPRRVLLSGALIAYGNGPKTVAEWMKTATYGDVYQDWYRWLQDADLDFGVPMNYDRDSSPTQAGYFRAWSDWEKDHQGRSRVVIGVGSFENYPEDSMAQVQRALQPTAAGNRAVGIALYSYASTSLYGTDDFYLNPADMGYLPRQPYAPDPSPKALAARAAQFNDWFWGALSAPASYPDPALGSVPTRPIFLAPAPIPSLR